MRASAIGILCACAAITGAMCGSTASGRTDQPKTEVLSLQLREHPIRVQLSGDEATFCTHFCGSYEKGGVLAIAPAELANFETMLTERVARATRFQKNVGGVALSLRKEHPSEAEEQAMRQFLKEERGLFCTLSFAGALEGFQQEMTGQKLEASAIGPQVDVEIRSLRSIQDGIASGKVKSIEDMVAILGQQDDSEWQVQLANGYVSRILERLTTLKDLANFEGAGEIPNKEQTAIILNDANATLSRIMVGRSSFLERLSRIKTAATNREMIVTVAVANLSNEPTFMSPVGRLSLGSQPGSPTVVLRQAPGGAELTGKSSGPIVEIKPHAVTRLSFETEGFPASLRATRVPVGVELQCVGDRNVLETRVVEMLVP